MNQFIDIEWNIATHDRDNYYLSIDCLKKEYLGKEVKIDCCLKSQQGCNISECGCKPEDGWIVRLYDKHTNLIDEKEYNSSFSTIIISKNSDGIPNISVK